MSENDIFADFREGLKILKEDLQTAQRVAQTFRRTQSAEDEGAAVEAAYRFFILNEYFIGKLIERIELADAAPHVPDEYAHDTRAPQNGGGE